MGPSLLTQYSLTPPSPVSWLGKIRQLKLRAKYYTRPSALVVVQPHGSRPPFFCVHGFNSYFHLARFLGPDQPLYGLAQHLSGKQIRHTRIEDIASYYLQELRAIQPEGPYFLGGHSIGAMIAFEMSQQLQEQGERVALLALIGPSPVNYGNSSVWDKENDPEPGFMSLQSTWSRHFTNLAALDRYDKLAYILERAGGRINGCLITVACRIVHTLKIPMPESLQAFYLDQIVYGTIYHKAMKAYIPQTYPGNVILFQPEGSSDKLVLGWKKLVTGRLEIQKVSGDHLSILAQPHIELCAKQLAACLERAQTKKRPT